MPPEDSNTHVKFAKTATFWSVHGFLNVESPVDIGLFDHYCRRMEDLLATRTAQSKFQRMTFHTTSLAASRVCATVEDWPHLFRDTKRTGCTCSGSGRREKRQLLIGTALGTVFGGILWNEISDWVQDTMVTDAIEKLQEDMAVLRNYTAVVAAKIRKRFDKEFLIQSAITKLGSHIASYDTAIWRLVSGYRHTPPLLTAEGCHRIWTRWTKELPCALPFGEEVLSELPASYSLEDGTLYLHLHLPLLDRAYHLYNLQDFPVSGPLGKPIYLRSDDTDTLAVSEDARMYALLDPEDLRGCLTIGHSYLCVLPYARRDFTTSCVAALWAGLEHAAVEKCTAVPVTDPFVIVSGRGKDAAWLELFVQQDTAYNKTCHNGTVDVGKWTAGRHRILHGHSEYQLSTEDSEIPTDLRRSFMLTVDRSMPLLEGLELGVKDDELPPSPASSSLDHHRHVGIAGFGFAITAGLSGAHRVWDRHHEASLRLQDQHTAPLKKERLVIQN